MTTLSILRVLTTDVERLLGDLDRRLAEAPGFFTGMPVVLDLEPVKEAGVAVPWLSELAHHLWQQELAPIAVAAGDARIEDAGREAGLGVVRLPDGGGKRRKADEKTIEAGGDAAPAPSRIVTQPVRSGQQIYARGGDLVVLAPVSPGAELLADGHIHIYGPLRGRALAGVQGDAGARIFCQSLNAELIAIAGHYQVSEHMEEAHRGRSVQIHLSGEMLCIEPLAS